MEIASVVGIHPARRGQRPGGRGVRGNRPDLHGRLAVANEPQYRKVLGYLRAAREEGATVACGGGPDEALGGYFVRPTVLTGVGPGATVVREEIFGPVLSAYTFTDEDEALKLANDTPYGLAGAVWTKDVHRAHRVAARIRAGTVWVELTGGTRDPFTLG